MLFGRVVPPTTQWGREYETIYILRPNVDGDEAEKVAERVRDVMKNTGGTLTKVETWGKRKLAYAIKRYTRGIFVHLTFVGPDGLVAELERNLRLVEPVIRYQTIRLRDEVALEEVSVDEEAVTFERIEQSEDEVEETYAERLGLAEPRRPEAVADESEDADPAAFDADGEGETEAAGDEAPAAAAPAAEAPEDDDGEEATDE